MATTVKISIETVNESHLIRLIRFSGQIDESNLELVKEQISPILQDDMVIVTIFNFKKLDFINSPVIGYILSIYNTTKKLDKEIVVVEANDNILNILNLVGLPNLISHYDNIAEALESINIHELEKKKKTPKRIKVTKVKKSMKKS